MAMRYLVLACDYDGTLAAAGQMDPATVEAIRQLRATGRRVVLLTGRELPDLLALLPEPELFDRIVAENGALLYRPVEREERPLAEPPPERFIAELKRRQVTPLSIGRVIVATWEPEERTVLEVIRDQGLERQLIFNKGAVMVLPSGVNKATGLDAALDELGLSRHNCVAVGDAENDHAFLTVCECSVAVANALPSLKERADMVTAADHGAGVAELADRLLASDLAELAPRLERHSLVLGADAAGRELRLPVHGSPVLVAGTS
ncbi:MAG TPA: HAD family hydrolase, partial [Planctomycetota bacterium]|nr:HAD family hydrolase [Planctomycetota bacterium]